MLGLGAGIDYALLIVGRYREQLAAGDSVPHAARVANATAGTSVVAAGAIVVVAISGLLATGIPFVGRMEIGSAIVIACVAVGAVTVLPTLMGAFARRLLRPRKPEHVEPSRRFARWGELIVRRPALSATVGVLVLALLCIPFLSLRLGQPDDGNDRAGSVTRVAYDRLAEGFGPGFTDRSCSRPPRRATAPARRRSNASVRPWTQTRMWPSARSPGRRRGDAAILDVIPASSPQDERTTELVSRLREDVLPRATADSPVNVYVGGATATFQDLADRIASRLPLFIAMVVGLSVLLLMAVFRSLWVPIVSALFNLLSIGAAYGVVVLVFQKGLGSGLLGVDGEVPIVLRAAVHVRHPVRAVDGLQRLPAVANL